MQKILLRFKKLLVHPLTKGSLVVFLGSAFGGLGNYLYHLLMGRMLGPVDYSVLASLISLTYLLSVPMGTLHLVVVKFVSNFKGKKKFKAINALFQRITKQILPFSLLGLLLFLIFSPLIISFLHLDSTLPLMIIGAVFFVGIFSTVNQAVLQGLLRFGYLTAGGIFTALVRVSVAILLVILGLKVGGALFALLAAGIFSYFFTLWPLRALPLPAKERGFPGQEMLRFSFPVFFSSLAFTSLYTTDIILARHFLPAQEAGFYSASATLGKVVFFASNSMITVMFPMVSERESDGQDYRDLLLLSLGLVLAICFGITFVYFLAPSLMIKLLFGSQYLAASIYLPLFAVFLSLYSLSYLLIQFYLSIKKLKVAFLAIAAAMAQVIFISFFHQNLTQLIWVSILDLGLLFVSLLLYYFFSDAQEKKATAFSNHPRL